MAKQSIVASGGILEFDINVTFTEPSYGQVVVTVVEKAKPQQIVYINAPSVGYYSISAVQVKDKNNQLMQVTTVNNGVWSFVMPSSNVTIVLTESENRPCLAADTMITLANNDQIPFYKLQPTDVVKVWDFDKGCYSSAELLWLPPVATAQAYFEITTDCSKKIQVIENHRAFDLTTCKFERMTNMIGHHIWTVDGPETVVDICFVQQPIEFRNAVSFYHMNIIANGILTSTGFNNLYPIENMKYCIHDRQIRKLSEYSVSIGWYNGLRLNEHYTSAEDTRKAITKWGKDQWLLK